jgi:hypothetical protein
MARFRSKSSTDTVKVAVVTEADVGSKTRSALAAHLAGASGRVVVP